MKSMPESSTREVLAGLVERVTFHNAENGFCVLRTKARGHRDVVTVVGRVASSPPASGSPRRAMDQRSRRRYPSTRDLYISQFRLPNRLISMMSQQSLLSVASLRIARKLHDADRSARANPRRL